VVKPNLQYVLVDAVAYAEGGKTQSSFSRLSSCQQKFYAFTYMSNFSDKVNGSAAAVEQYRAQMRKDQPESYGFASMASIPIAHGAAYDLRNEHPKGIIIRLAPNPNDIVSVLLACPFRALKLA
jgi:hypothetical protein